MQDHRTHSNVHVMTMKGAVVASGSKHAGRQIQGLPLGALVDDYQPTLTPAKRQHRVTTMDRSFR